MDAKGEDAKMKRGFSWALAGVMAGLCAIAATNDLAAQDRETWLKSAQLGPAAPARQDWAAIEEAARKEGTVVIYSVSSRIFDLAENFQKRYGVKIVAHDVTSLEQLEKLRREHAAGIYSVDILFNNDSPTMLKEFLPKNLVWNFVPDDAKSQLSQDEMEPFLVQRWSSRVLFYNSQANPDGAPIKNLWDLTRPEWKGKFQIPDPTSGVTGVAFQTILQHADEMNKAYEAAFGEKIKYSPKVVEVTRKLPDYGQPNAAIERVYRILQNQPVYENSTNKLFANVAAVNQQKPAIGMTTFSKLRDVKKGVHEAAAAFGVKPAFGVAYPTVLAIADRAPHPNAAKLLIREMIGTGFAPWDVLGDYAARADVEAGQVKKYEKEGMPPFEQSNMWKADPDYIYTTGYSFTQLLLALQ
jgi:iron(III) transport system substrate-binding protein